MEQLGKIKEGGQAQLPRGPATCSLSPAPDTRLTFSWGTSHADTKAHRAHGPRQRSPGHGQVRISPHPSPSPLGLAMANLPEKLTPFLLGMSIPGRAAVGRDLAQENQTSASRRRQWL